MPAADLKKRQDSWAEKKKKLANPNFSVSTTRLSVRNFDRAPSRAFPKVETSGARVASPPAQLERLFGRLRCSVSAVLGRGRNAAAAQEFVRQSCAEGDRQRAADRHKTGVGSLTWRLLCFRPPTLPSVFRMPYFFFVCVCVFACIACSHAYGRSFRTICNSRTSIVGPRPIVLDEPLYSLIRPLYIPSLFCRMAFQPDWTVAAYPLQASRIRWKPPSVLPPSSSTV